MTSQRTLRSTTRQNLPNELIIIDDTPQPSFTQQQLPSIPPPVTFSNIWSGQASAITNSGQPPIRLITKSAKLPNISASELRILRAKQAKLRTNRDAILESVSTGRQNQKAVQTLIETLPKTLIFAHPEAGTAVCINSDGWILTCAHCFEASYEEDDPEGWKKNRLRWLIYYNGTAVLVECQTVDLRRDLALARVIALELDPADFPSSNSDSSAVVIKTNQTDLSSDELSVSFAAAKVTESDPRVGTSIICIGQPGRDDLESKTQKKTPYHLVEMSRGYYRGLRPDIDPHACFDIGSLMHNAWTYWGHSGAPLVKVQDGMLVGIHSSWDDQTGMRHGVPWMAIRHFLEEHGAMGG